MVGAGSTKRFVSVAVEGPRVRVNGVGKTKEFDLPPQVAAWASDVRVRGLLEELLEDPALRGHVTSAGAIRSLVLLLYCRYIRTPPYRAAPALGVSHEQMYRIERALRRAGIYEMAVSRLELIREGLGSNGPDGVGPGPSTPA